ncbi:hypothetical protein PVAND_001042 [Polypedilum vanderplanki]|uniref:CN hydrolase domain-containing protein n=1 Tax=Polypedilum vanderplanki TaxID=319348 RepID=A0A9J6BLS0_POLVA|nr:hypothetical protein PVAND_001042 [Polypedilum vanderplanki]
MFLLKLLTLVTFFGASFQLSSPSSSTYQAGVVEFNVGILTNRNSTTLLNERLARYLEILDNAPSTLDIIVFPELTLNMILTASEIPKPEDEITPCDDENSEVENFIRNISCSAKKYKRYVVINITEKSKCPDPEMIGNEDPQECRPNGLNYYNTNVVFDRNGKIVSRYRKYHLFRESVDRPLKPEFSIFETDFGVTFGQFICFDIIFKTPALDLVRNYNLTDFIFPALWFGELPFLTAVQLQQNWAYANNVNMLAAGTNNVPVGSTGSGIYGGKKGAYVAEMAKGNITELYTATIYKIKNFPEHENVTIEHNVIKHSKDEMKNLLINRDFLDFYEMEFIDDINGTHYQENDFCESEICCKIKVNFTILNSEEVPHYQYAMAFFHGNRTFQGFADANITACALIACPSRNTSSCGSRNEELENFHTWTSIEVEIETPKKDGNIFYMPTSLDSSIMPLQPGDFDYEEIDLKNERVRNVMKLNSHVDELLTFGIYGFDYDLDYKPENSGEKHEVFVILIAVSFVITIL